MSFDPKTLQDQISLGVKMHLGAREWLYSYRKAFVQFDVGGGRPRRRFIIHYNSGSDTYRIELGRVTRNWEWVVDDVADEITADILNATLMNMFGKVAG
jgi:hypothetical protein